MTRSRIALLLAVLAACLVASGCGNRGFTLRPYKINIQQGNFLEEEDIDLVQPGMTRSQVRFLLGTPMVADAFNSNRWDYVYYIRMGRNGETSRRSVVVWFEGDNTVRVEKRRHEPLPWEQS